MSSDVVSIPFSAMKEVEKYSGMACIGLLTIRKLSKTRAGRTLL